MFDPGLAFLLLMIMTSIGPQITGSSVTESPIPLASSDQYVDLLKPVTLQCPLPAINKDGRLCGWWKNETALVSTDTSDYQVFASDANSRCSLRIVSVKAVDAAPTEYRCGDGHWSDSPLVIRLWLIVAPSQPKLTITGYPVPKTTLNLSPLPPSILPLTITCHSSGGRPAPRLYLELDERVLETNSEVNVTPGHLMSASIRWRDEGRQLKAGLILRCWSRHPAYGSGRKADGLNFVGQYPKETLEANPNVVVLSSVGGASALLIIAIVVLVVVIIRIKRKRSALPMQPVAPRPLPRRPLSPHSALITGRPLPPLITCQSERLPATTDRDSYLVPSMVAYHQVSFRGGKQVALNKDSSVTNGENVYHEIGQPENNYIIVH